MFDGGMGMGDRNPINGLMGCWINGAHAWRTGRSALRTGIGVNMALAQFPIYDLWVQQQVHWPLRFNQSFRASARLRRFAPPLYFGSAA